MRKPGRFLVLFFSLPFLAACFTVAQVPVPRTSPEREDLDLRGVVLTNGGAEEVIEFSQVHQAVWTPNSLSIVGDVEQDGSTQTLTRLVPITELSGLLVRQLNAGVTSAIIGGIIVGTAVAIAGIVTGKGETYNPGQ